MSATQTYRKTPKGVLTNIYCKQVERSIRKGLPTPEYTLAEFHSLYLNDKTFLSIYNNWINGGCQYYDKPSFDRADPDKGYTKDNIQVMTWMENRVKGDRENAIRFTTAVVMFDVNGKKLMEFESIKKAVEYTGLNQGLITMVCQGKRKHTCGYIFRYRGDKFRKNNLSLLEVAPCQE